MLFDGKNNRLSSTVSVNALRIIFEQLLNLANTCKQL